MTHRQADQPLPSCSTVLLPPPSDVLKLFGSNAHVTGAFFRSAFVSVRRLFVPSTPCTSPR